MDLIDKILNNRFLIIEKIGESELSTSYIGKDLLNDSKDVVVKLLKQEIISSSLTDIIRFRNEVEALSRLDHPSILKILDAEKIDNNYYMVTEFAEGKKLLYYLKNNNRLSIDFSVNIIYRVAIVLDTLHRNSIIHRDLNPGNIYILPDESDIKLTGFAVSHIKETSNISHDDEIFSMFSYISPEQCGGISREVDERSDIYSLGIILYQMITGYMPFEAHDVRSLIHKHLTLIPDPPSRYNQAVPEVIDEIVMKMISKDPDERYQTADGLIRDIEKYKRGLFKINVGEEDRIEKLKLQIKLIGLENEISSVKEQISRSSRGEKTAVIISGESGSGKTRFINEFKSYSITHNGLFLYGRCFKGENSTHLSAFKEIINIYIHKYQNFIQSKKENITRELTSGLSEMKKFLLKFSLSLQKIIGDGLENDGAFFPENDSESDNFLTALRMFFETISRFENFVIIAIEDIQWADENTIKLLLSLLKSPSESKLMMMTSIRKNEMKSSLLKNLTSNEELSSLAISNIDIQPFDHKKMTQYISHLLQSSDDDISDITDFIFTKSKGNPLFAAELLNQAIKDRVIENIVNRWQLNKNRLNIIDDSVTMMELVLRRVENLTTEEKNVLTCASIIGRKFSTELLFKIFDYPQEEIIKIIDKATKLHLLNESNEEKGTVSFTHEKIHDLLNKSIEPSQKKEMHNRIAYALEQQNIETIDKHIFHMLHHYLAADNLNKVNEYSYPAALMAREKFAYEDALKYFNITKELTEMQDAKGSEKWFQCVLNLGEINVILGNYQYAINNTKTVIPIVSNPEKKSMLMKLICRAYYKSGDFFNAEEYARQGLLMIGEKIPVTSKQTKLSIFIENIKIKLKKFIPEKMTYEKSTRKRKSLSEIASYYEILFWLYCYTDVKKTIRTVFRLFNIAEYKLGKSKELSSALRFYASIFAARGQFNRSIEYYMKSIRIDKELKNKRGTALSLQLAGFFYQWQGDFPESRNFFKKSNDYFSKTGELHEFGKNTLGNFFNNYFMADYAEAEMNLKEFANISEKTKDEYGILTSKIYYVRLFIEKGEFDLAENLVEEIMDQVNEKSVPFLQFLCLVETGRLYLSDNRYIKACSILDRALKLYNKNNFVKPMSAHLFPQLAEAYIRKYQEDFLPMENTFKEKSKKFRELKKICQLSLKMTKVWPVYHANSLRIYALYNIITKNYGKAEKLFNKAIVIATRIDRKYQLARVLYDYGLLLIRTGRIEKGKETVERAFYIFNSIGSRVYRKRAYSLVQSNDDLTPMQRLLDRDKLSSVMKVSQLISSILNQDKLIDTLMNNAIESSGAQRGFLFLLNEETGKLELKSSKMAGAERENPYPRQIIQEVLQSGRKVIINNALYDSNYKNDPSVQKHLIKSIICLPIQTHEKTIGIFYMDNPLTPNVFNHDIADFLNVFIMQGAIALENANLYNSLEKKVEERTHELNQAYLKIQEAYKKLQIKDRIISEDLNLAKKVQSSLMAFDHTLIKDFSFSIHYHPMSEVGGDFYDIFELSKEYIRIFIADATGHGVQAALLTAIIKSEYEKIKFKKFPGKLLKHLNNTFLKGYRSLNLFFTCFVLDIDRLAKRITFSSAGHPPQIVLTGGETILINAKGKMLGVLENMEYETGEMSLRDNDKIFLFTDGIFEQFNQSLEEFGLDRVKEVLKTNSDKDVFFLNEAIIKKLSMFLDGGLINSNDDSTLIGVEFKK